MKVGLALLQLLHARYVEPTARRPLTFIFISPRPRQGLEEPILNSVFPSVRDIYRCILRWIEGAESSCEPRLRRDEVFRRSKSSRHDH